MFSSMMLMMMTVMRMIEIDDDLDDDIALPCLSLLSGFPDPNINTVCGML